MRKEIEYILKPIHRRKALGLLAGLAGSALLASCGGSSSKSNTSNNELNLDNDSGSGTNDSGSDLVGTSWLSGGTQAMQVEFPPASDPFASGLGNLCSLTDSFTIGPCYFDVTDSQDDISEAQAGVPMTLALKLVDAQCSPIAGAQIEVWWCDALGRYSGDNTDSTGAVSSFNRSYCTGNDTDALAARWFRGIKTTDTNGNVYFKACFPGWYGGRTTHIHFRIVHNGSQQLVSQFCFEDALCNDIYQNHSDYTGQAKDTSNSTDSVFRASGYEDYVFEVERQWDNSILAYKAIQIAV